MLQNISTIDSRLLRVSCLALLAGVLFVTDGLSGMAVAIVIAPVWIAIRTPYTVAIGQLLYVLLVADSGLFVAFGTGAFVFLFVPGLLEQWHPNTAIFSIGTLIAATGILASSRVVESTLLAAFVLCIGFGILAYMIHRYELVRLGLVDEHA